MEGHLGTADKVLDSSGWSMQRGIPKEIHTEANLTLEPSHRNKYVNGDGCPTTTAADAKCIETKCICPMSLKTRHELANHGSVVRVQGVGVQVRGVQWFTPKLMVSLCYLCQVECVIVGFYSVLVS